MSERLVIISQDQQLTETDLSNIGEFAQSGIDHVVNDGIEPGFKFTGFAVSQTGPAQVTVSAGRLYQGGSVFYRDDDGGVVLSLLNILPAVTQKVVTIAVWGQEIDTATQPRTFLVDVDTEQTEARAVATERRRYTNVNAVSGVEAADPVAPALNSNTLAVAYVKLNSSGIVSITPASENQLESVRSVSQRATELEGWRLRTGQEIDTLSTTVAGLQGQLSKAAPSNLVFEMARDVARLKERSELPATYTSYSADRYLDTTKSDTGNVNYLAAIEEGVKFAPAAEAYATVGLLNPLDPLVKQQDNFVLPVFTEIERQKVVGKDAEISIASYQFQTVSTVKRTVTRQRVRYGVSMTYCTNSAWWRSGSYDPVTRLFTRNGESWVVSNEDAQRALIYNRQIRVTQYFVDTYDEVYWDVVTESESISAAFVAETFLNSTPGYVTATGLYFTRKAATGNVRVLICECDASGKPVFNKVVAKTVLDVADIKVYPEQTKVPLSPTFLEKGKRYAIVIASGGNHYLAAVDGQKNTNGTLFYSTDGAFSQGDLTKDIAYSLYFASFTSPRIEVQLNPLQLSGGIANIDLNFDTVAPEGTSISFEVQVSGTWKTISGSNLNLFIGLPPLLPFRAVLLGTTDVMPGFGIGARSQTKTMRPRADFKHISTGRTLPSACTTIQVTARLEYWDPAHHTIACKLLTGASYSVVETVDATATQSTPDPNAIIRTFTFNVSPGITQFKIQFEGTTDNALIPFHISERYDLAFT